MEIIQHNTVREFLARAAPLLERAEAEDNFLWGLASEMSRWPERFCEHPSLVTLEDPSSIHAAALLAPPRKLVVTGLTTKMAKCLAEELYRRGITLPGVVGPSPGAECFARCWSEFGGHTARLDMGQNVYRSDRVEWGIPCVGRLRPANPDDLALLVPWYEQFHRDLRFDGPHNTRGGLQEKVDYEQLYVWENGQVTSMAAWARETSRGVTINLVYTPSEFRRNGYATACVAALTQHLLDQGHASCFLHADRQNPTSNAIYQKIGYRGVCEFEDWSFGSFE